MDYFEKQKKQQDALAEGKCANCFKHNNNGQPWVGEGGTMAYVHGAYTYWCNCCILKAQVKYARQSARQLPRLEKKLAKTKCL